MSKQSTFPSELMISLQPLQSWQDAYNALVAMSPFTCHLDRESQVLTRGFFLVMSSSRLSTERKPRLAIYFNVAVSSPSPSKSLEQTFRHKRDSPLLQSFDAQFMTIGHRLPCYFTFKSTWCHGWYSRSCAMCIFQEVQLTFGFRRYWNMLQKP